MRARISPRGAPLTPFYAIGCAGVLAAVGCGGSLIDEPIRSEPAPSAAAVTAQAEKPRHPPGALFRQDINETVEEGLGYFLQRVTVDPDLAGGKFQGFRIVELRPAEYWQGVDLKPGDVVTRVNGMPIERDIDAYQAFQALRAAAELRVTLIRGGAPRELVFAIVDASGKPTSGKTPASPVPPPASTSPGTAPARPSGDG